MERLTDGLNLPGQAPTSDRDRRRDQHPGTKPAPAAPRAGQGLKVALALLLCAGCIALLSLRLAGLAGEPQGVGPVDGTGAGTTATAPATDPTSNPATTPASNATTSLASGSASAAPAPPAPPAHTPAGARPPGAPGADPATAPNQPRPVDTGPYPGRPDRDTPTRITPRPGG